MAYGANFYNASGTLALSITDRLLRLFGTYAYSGIHTAAQTVTVSGMADDDSWVVIPSDPFHMVVINSGSFTITKPAFTSTTVFSNTGTAYVFRV